MAGNLNLQTWILASDAGRRLGVSERTVRRLVAEGALHPRLVPIAGQSGHGNYFYDPDEVERVRLERQAAQTQVVPATRPIARTNGTALERLPPVITVPVKAQATRAVAALPIDRKRYLTPEEAVAYTGLGLFYIESKLGRGAAIGPHGARVYRREKLEKL